MCKRKKGNKVKYTLCLKENVIMIKVKQYHYNYFILLSLSFPDTNECIPNPCLNGAVCVDGLNGYTCNCPAGYTGVNCETSKLTVALQAKVEKQPFQFESWSAWNKCHLNVVIIWYRLRFPVAGCISHQCKVLILYIMIM